MEDHRSGVLIAAHDLAAQREGRAPIVILDIRDELKAAPSERQFIPDSIAAYLDADFSGAPSAAFGKRPLPEIAVFEARVRQWGINPDSLVIVYDDNAGAQASRAWWTFRWAGFSSVRILDGGLRAWRDAGFPVTGNPAKPGRMGTAELRAGQMPTLDADTAAALARQSRLLDARGRAAYVGSLAETGRPSTGHIPGASCAPSGEGIGPDGRFKSTEELRAYFHRLGADDRAQFGLYCGSGNAAAHLMVAAHIAGLKPSLYVGSWSAWSADPNRPIACGPEPGVLV